ncbi:MAG: hypothetical protein JO141_07425 [Bradyrhizobium sp.]|nr:hypothetical protein [Bradyrhizobium sp.]
MVTVSLETMIRYFFDLRSGDLVSVDEEGRMLEDIEAAHQEAVGSLADGIVGIMVEGQCDQHIAVEVRDELGAVLKVSAVFASKILRMQ